MNKDTSWIDPIKDAFNKALKKDKMKLHITENQWNEIPGEHKGKLRSWAELHKHGYPGIFLMSIGQMIEFLTSHRSPYLWSIMNNHRFDKKGHWSVDMVKRTKSPYKYTINESHELCDALWKAVREVLK